MRYLKYIILLIITIFTINSCTSKSSENISIEKSQNITTISKTYSQETSPQSIPSQTPSIKLYKIIEVIDGDTIKVDINSKIETVRFIGVDAPETVHPNKDVQAYGKEASDFTKAQLLEKEVRLEYDIEERDKYGRLLAYIYIGNEMFNKVLLREGYAQLMTIPPNVKYVEEFIVLQKQAREQNKGLWSLPQTSVIPSPTSIPAKSITPTSIPTPKPSSKLLSTPSPPIQVSPKPTSTPILTPTPTPTPTPQQEIIVYITKTGEKYHRGTCRYLSQSKISINLKDAIRRGYTPCSVCKPPQ